MPNAKMVLAAQVVTVTIDRMTADQAPSRVAKAMMTD
jgi:hypothetical protein